MHNIAIPAYQSSMYFLFVSELWWTIQLATRLVLVLPALLNTRQRHKLRLSIWQWDCIIIWYYKSQPILHLYMMKVIHNLIVTSLASVSAQKLHLQVLKSSTCECARETLVHCENFTLECKCVCSTRTCECKLALNLYRTATSLVWRYIALGESLLTNIAQGELALSFELCFISHLALTSSCIFHTNR